MNGRFRLLIRKNKKPFIAALALLEVIVLLCTASFAWIEGSKSGEVNDNTSTISAGSGLVFIGENINSGVITLDNSIKLEDCSSADGRNFFFPTVGNIGKTSTADMVFRKGTDSDVNNGYISVDFAAYAANGSENNIYISNTSSVTSDNGGNLDAMRIAVNFNDGSQPVLLCPGREKPGYTQDVSAVTSINENGDAETSLSRAQSFSTYWYGASPLTSIKGGESKKITVTIWLEGTDENCTSENCSLKNYNIDLTLTTAADYTRKVTFVDYSPSQWVDNVSANGETFMFAYDKAGVPSSGDKTQSTFYLMEETITEPYSTYTVYVPDYVTDVGFARLDSADENMSYNYWADTAADNMSSSDINTYYAIGQGQEVDDGKNCGYWVRGDSAEVVEVYLLDSGGMTVGAYNPNIRIISSDYNLSQPSWGFSMRLIGYNRSNFSQKIYHMIVPKSATIKFEGNGRTSQNRVLANDSLRFVGDGSVKKIGYSLNSTGTDVELSIWDPTSSTLVVTNPVN